MDWRPSQKRNRFNSGMRPNKRRKADGDCCEESAEEYWPDGFAVSVVEVFADAAVAEW